MSSSPRGQKTHTLTHRTLATLGLLGLLSAGVVVVNSSEAQANGTCGLSGGGTEASPYLVTSADDLAKVGDVNCGLDAEYRQTENITLPTPADGESNHTPIGSFDGVYDGGNNTITGLTVDKSTNFVGLFGDTLENSKVENLTLIDVTIRANSYVGAVAGSPGGTITNVHVTSGRVEGGGAIVGGIAGENSGTVSNSTAGEDLHVEGESEVGGLIGQNVAILENSVSNASVKGESTVGGAVGNNADGSSISDSHARGDVTIVASGGPDGQGGGFAGANFNGDIDASSASGDVIGEGSKKYFGGFVGYHYGGAISNSLATGKVSGDSEVGGFAGEVGGESRGEDFQGEISDSYSTGDASGRDNVGGFVGNHQRSVGIENSYSLGEASGDSNVGGFAGKTTATVTNSFWDTETSGLEERDGVDDGATGKTTEEMTSITTFNNTNTEGLTTSWAIVAASAFEQPTGPTNEIWGIGAGVNCGYPFLYWQTESAITCETGGGGGTDSSQAEGSTSASGSSPEKQASSPAIHLDLQATVGQQVAGTTVVVGGQGLAPGSTMTLVVRSTPQTLVTGTVSSLGNFSTKIDLPALAPGSHTLTLSGTAPDGSLVTLTQGFTISATGTFSALGTVTGGQTTGLAVTGPGASLMWSGIAGLGLLFAGLALTAAKNGLRIRRSL